MQHVFAISSNFLSVIQHFFKWMQSLNYKQMQHFYYLFHNLKCNLYVVLSNMLIPREKLWIKFTILFKVKRKLIYNNKGQIHHKKHLKSCKTFQTLAKVYLQGFCSRNFIIGTAADVTKKLTFWRLGFGIINQLRLMNSFKNLLSYLVNRLMLSSCVFTVLFFV